jgi:hypothetical protein
MSEELVMVMVMGLCALCAVIGWSMGYGQASDEYKRRLGEQHDQIKDLSRALDDEIDKGYDIHMESKYNAHEIATGAADEVSEDWSNWK